MMKTADYNKKDQMVSNSTHYSWRWYWYYRQMADSGLMVIKIP
ncbi:hypothetical protein ACFLQW_04860 [Candidatus Zixiibacteriota bacterium]